jgi:hypothetical protein
LSICGLEERTLPQEQRNDCDVWTYGGVREDGGVKRCERRREERKAQKG